MKTKKVKAFGFAVMSRLVAVLILMLFPVMAIAIALDDSEEEPVKEMFNLFAFLVGAIVKGVES